MLCIKELREKMKMDINTFADYFGLERYEVKAYEEGIVHPDKALVALMNRVYEAEYKSSYYEGKSDAEIDKALDFGKKVLEESGEMAKAKEFVKVADSYMVSHFDLNHALDFDKMKEKGFDIRGSEEEREALQFFLEKMWVLERLPFWLTDESKEMIYDLARELAGYDVPFVSIHTYAFVLIDLAVRFNKLQDGKFGEISFENS